MRVPARISYARRRGVVELRGLAARLQRRSSLADRADYRTICREAATSEAVLARFKRDPRYASVLEHVTPAQGAAYLELALNRAPELEPVLAAVGGNDALGDPARADFEPHGAFSPTTLRYFKVLADLQCLFGSLDRFDIAEIGGGYGGQAFVIAQASAFASYTLVDLPEAADLQRVYLERLGVPNVRALTADELDGAGVPKTFDLVISNFAFSELTRPTQAFYLERILLRAQRGYLSLNHHAPRAYRSYSTQELLATLPGSRVLPSAAETAVDRKAAIDILVWGALPDALL